MADLIALEADKREILGKHVKKLRRDNIIPAIIYGPDNAPIPIQVDRRTLRHVLLEAGGTQLIEVQIGGEGIPVLARDVQRDILRGDLMHVDFYRVNMNRPIRAEIPVVVIGESEIVVSGEGIVTLLLNTIEVEALPTDLPPQIEVDVTGLNEIGAQIVVEELGFADTVTAITSSEELVLKIDYARAPEVEEEEEEDELLMGLEPSAEVEVITERRDDDEDDE